MSCIFFDGAENFENWIKLIFFWKSFKIFNNLNKIKRALNYISVSSFKSQINLPLLVELLKLDKMELNL